MMLIIAFIAAAIMLSVSVTILGSTSNSFDFKGMSGYKSSGTTDDNNPTSGKYPPDTWAGACWSIEDSTIDSLNLLVVVLVVIAAITILVVVRML